MASAVGLLMANGHRAGGKKGKEWKGERKGEESVAISESTGALWVYAIKNVNICRRLVIGCKYGGGRVRGPVLGPDGRGGPCSSFVSLFIGMHGRARRTETHAPL